MPFRPPDDDADRSNYGDDLPEEAHDQFRWDPVDPPMNTSDEKLRTIVFRRCPPLGLQFDRDYWRYEMAFPFVVRLEEVAEGLKEALQFLIPASDLDLDTDEPPEVHGIFTIVPVSHERFITN